MKHTPVFLLLFALCACDRAPDAEFATELQVSELLGGSDTLNERAFAPHAFAFPRDHGSHPTFRTEWWYFTGNVTAQDGTALGYQLTFFRSALNDSARSGESAWRARDGWMAHFAVSDAGTRTFRAHEQFARGAAGLAGVAAAPFRVWLHDWNATSEGPEMFPLRLRAQTDDIAIDLLLEEGKPIVLQGENGLSRKGAEPGNASYYYSLTRMPTHGTIRARSTTHIVTGASWLDREWGTSTLGTHLAGWDWLALQLNDSTELMLYRLRRHDGTADPFSALTYIDQSGIVTRLNADRFTMTPVRRWGDAQYPTAWRIEAPSLQLAIDVAAVLDDQELRLAVRYWEGMVTVRGVKADIPVTGRGYLEMTGYGVRSSGAR